MKQSSDYRKNKGRGSVVPVIIKPVFLNPRAAARHRVLGSIIPGRERP